jgi:hydrogenase nickel incorporation protein HypA/HybF
MHELSLVRSLLAQVREAASPHADAAVDEVVISIGPLAGVEPLLFASAFESLTVNTVYCGTRLVIEKSPLRLNCQSCGYEFETEQVDFACTACASVRTRVIAGDGVILRRVVLREWQPEEAVPW